MSQKLIRERFALGRQPFKCFDPFLFCMHHDDTFPVANPKLVQHNTKNEAEERASMGPDPALLARRDMGSDFSYIDGWSMYHGEVVPGFPSHPHRGFETITVVRKGTVDHSDSVGCTARYSKGDTQWLTAGKGIQHSEMFPLLNQDTPNPCELFQIWLNLPRRNKMCDPYFTMFWDEDHPHVTLQDVNGKGTADLTLVAGAIQGAKAMSPPPDSWASQPGSDVAVWVLDIPKSIKVQLPAAESGSEANRAFYFVRGDAVKIQGEKDAEEVLKSRTGVKVDAGQSLTFEAIDEDALLVMLQGKPIGEPVVQHGPFVMNTREEIMQCFADYSKTQFGGWPWTTSDHTHSRETARHAIHLDGRKEFPGKK
ncbi:Pirin-like protein [Angomonas deanei]|uniref:Pirin/Pirin C-terminal cupin domain containing protein, putative n=1 Tax=Angomonas deanei TaxID=59799 RepID=A0A7G2C711_9TRYP|nr:Pirin-like protein [Angomonas deanei]CAD2215600.1 Pirin/Pirin C-terminal cupin domain containing protein, putative [Angomonas deanei]|eukprot:EPY14986.1 Pirin-like protein [Angomonas deanei]